MTSAESQRRDPQAGPSERSLLHVLNVTGSALRCALMNCSTLRTLTSRAARSAQRPTGRAGACCGRRGLGGWERARSQGPGRRATRQRGAGTSWQTRGHRVRPSSRFAASTSCSLCSAACGVSAVTWSRRSRPSSSWNRVNARARPSWVFLTWTSPKVPIGERGLATGIHPPLRPRPGSAWRCLRSQVRTSEVANRTRPRTLIAQAPCRRCASCGSP